MTQPPIDHACCPTRTRPGMVVGRVVSRPFMTFRLMKFIPHWDAGLDPVYGAIRAEGRFTRDTAIFEERNNRRCCQNESRSRAVGLGLGLGWNIPRLWTGCPGRGTLVEANQFPGSLGQQRSSHNVRVKRQGLTFALTQRRPVAAQSRHRVRGAVAPRLEQRTRSRENQVSNPFAAVSKFGQFRSLHVTSVHSAV